MAVLSPTADFICEICLINYDTIGRKPYSLVPCGHTFCLSCMNQITSNLCPTCRSPFEGRVPNWEITRRLDPKATSVAAPPAPVLGGNINNSSPVPATNLVRSMESEREPTCMDDFLNTSTKRKCKLVHFLKRNGKTYFNSLDRRSGVVWVKTILDK